MSTVKDNASVTSGGGFFKRLGRKRSLSGVGSPKSPTSPVLDSAPWLPPLAGLEGEDSLAPPGVSQQQQQATSTSSPAPRTSRLSLSSNSGPPILNLPGYIAPPVTASATSHSASSKPSAQFFRGSPQLSIPERLDTSLHLEVTQAGILATTPTAEKPQTETARATSPSPSAARATSPAPPSTHKAPTSPPRPSRKEPSISSDKSNLEKTTSITKAFGSLFKRSKTKDHLDSLSTPVEEKRKTSTSKRASLLPEKKETTPPPSAAAVHTNGAAKAESPALTDSKPAPETVVAPAASKSEQAQAETPAAGLAQTGTTFTTNDGQVRTFGEEAPVGGFTRPAGFAKTSASGLRAEPAEEPAAPVAELAQTGKTFTTDDGEVKTFGEAAPVGGFARPAGFAKTNVSSLRAGPVEEPAAPVAEAVPAPTSEFAQSGKTFTTDDGQVKTFGEAAPVGGFARPAGFSGAKASALRAEPVDETPVAEAAPSAGLAQTGAVFTTNDGEVRTFGEPAPVGGFTRPAGFERQTASALRAEPVEETPAPVAEVAPVQTEEVSSSIGAEGTTFTTNDGETRKFGEPAPAGGFPKPAGFAGSSVRALRAQFEQSKKAKAAEAVKSKTPSPAAAEHVALHDEPKVEEAAAAPEVVEAPVVEEAETPAAPVVEEPVVEEVKPVEAANGDAHKAEEVEDDRVATPEPKVAAPAS